MNSKRVFYILISFCLVLSILIIGTAVLGNIIFKKQSEKLSELKAQNEALDQQSIALVKAKQDVEKYSELSGIARQIVPQDKDQAKTIREINRIAAESGVILSQISFESSTLGESKKPAAPAPTDESTSEKPTDDGAASTPPAGAVTSPKQALTQVEPVPGINGVFSLGINIQTDSKKPIPYEQFLTFLEKLESNRRTAHVVQIQVTPDEGGQRVSFSLVLNAYVKP